MLLLILIIWCYIDYITINIALYIVIHWFNSPTYTFWFSRWGYISGAGSCTAHADLLHSQMLTIWTEDILSMFSTYSDLNSIKFDQIRLNSDLNLVKFVLFWPFEAFALQPRRRWGSVELCKCWGELCGLVFRQRFFGERPVLGVKEKTLREFKEKVKRIQGNSKRIQREFIRISSLFHGISGLLQVSLSTGVALVDSAVVFDTFCRSTSFEKGFPSGRSNELCLSSWESGEDYILWPRDTAEASWNLTYSSFYSLL